MVTVQQLNGGSKEIYCYMHMLLLCWVCYYPGQGDTRSMCLSCQGNRWFLGNPRQSHCIIVLIKCNFHSKNYSFYLYTFSFLFIKNQVCSIYNWTHQRMFAKHTYIQSISSTALPISGKTPISRGKKT
jgi:hypothetical protein